MLDRVHEDLFVVATPHRFFGLQLGTKMTVVRLRDGSLLLHSPVAATPELKDAVARLGPVSHLVCPNLFHHSYAGEWVQACPDAQLHGPPELARKRPDLAFDHALGSTPPPDWEGALVPVPILGCMLHETVFVHPASRTVISSDLTENFATSDDTFTRLYLKAAGIHGRVGWSRFLRFLYRDRRAARASIDALLEHEFDRIVLAHGELIGTNGKDAVRDTFRFL